MRIGVFDSGIGGEVIATNLRRDFPAAEIISISDKENVPYGTKSPVEILQLTESAIRPLIASGCDVIVIACNTATAVAIESLRERHPTQPFIGLEPMVKPAAALSKTGVVAVFATPATLASAKYAEAKATYAPTTRVLEPDCSEWASLIEADSMDRELIEEVVEDCLSHGADIIVLGCTHYHWIKDEIVETAGLHAVVLDPSEAISRRVRELLGV
ncbi:glutamate racemase [Candidatus Saccharibacteria bacterium]|nr:glutamate racemase [Candidatus Saccharibacteria bacterium]